MRNLEKTVSFRLSHDLNGCQDTFRKESALRTTWIVSSFAQEIEVGMFFPKNINELLEAIQTLPSKVSNFLPNFAMGEVNSIVTAERVARVLELWRKIYSLRPEFTVENPYPLSQIKLFAIHLHVWMAFEEFLRGETGALLYLEDDINLPENFEDVVRDVLDSLPRGWDFFNFIIPEEESHRYKSDLILPSTNLCVNFQRYPGACLLVSRNGARKLLNRYLYEVDNLPLDFNLSTAFDVCLSNVKQLPEHNFAVWQLNQDPRSRTFNTYTFTPHSGKAVSWRNFNSTWR